MQCLGKLTNLKHAFNPLRRLAERSNSLVMCCNRPRGFSTHVVFRDRLVCHIFPFFRQQMSN